MLVSISVWASGCATSPNEELCVRELAPDGAGCGWMYEGDDRDMSESEYLEQETGMIFFPDPDAWGNIRIALLQFCRESPTCRTKKLKKRLDTLEKRLGLSHKNILNKAPSE